ncbi:MAG TPA: exopolysaccharide biosynthesis polyprenyl glycosylphosphotransferase [Rubricoccaceae bacterium]|nr:exopolysaccharide biosynthesis polyprenyl glycosylphosphotransferase [Rubricoccaceae bacterium]
MNTLVLLQEHPFAERVALARSRATEFAQRWLANAVVLAGFEAGALALSLLVAGLIRAGWAPDAAMVVGWGWVVIPLYLAGASMARLLPGWGMGSVEELRRIVLLLLGVFGLVIAGLWLSGPGPGPLGVSSRLTLGLGGLFALFAVPLARVVAKGALVEWDAWGVPVVVYGAGHAGALVVRQLQEERGLGYTPVAVFDDDRTRWGDFLDTVPIVGGTDRVTTEAAVAILAMPEHERARQIEILEGPLTCYRTVLVIPDLIEAPSLWVKPRDLAGLLGLEISSNLTRPFPRLAKRAFDLAAVLLTAPLWLPLVGLAAALVWIEDRHSPLFRQVRVGQDGRLFETFKLRTMVPDADAALQRALDADPALRAEWETFFKLERDPRITRLGALLRRTSLDELPQLFNVLRGEMSLVGPRPLPRYHHLELPPRVRELRERVRPGITGLWQVMGRSDLGTEGMERWDPYYVRNWSLWLDAVVLVRTLRVIARRDGAY